MIRVVLYGGEDAVTTSLADTWEWNGTDWNQLTVTRTPGPMQAHALSYESERRWTVAFGAQGTWDHSTISSSNHRYFGGGCTGSNGKVSLKIDPWAGPYIGTQWTVGVNNLPTQSLASLLYGISDTKWQKVPLSFSLQAFGAAPGCMLYTNPMITVSMNPSMKEFLSPVPNNTALIGLSWFSQALIYGLSAASPQWLSANAVEVTVGVK